MGKDRRLNAVLDRKDFFVAAALTFAAAIGFLSAILSIGGYSLGTWATTVVLTATVALSLIVHLRKFSVPQFSVDDIVVEAIDSAPQMTLHCPNSPALVIEAKKLARACFSGSISIEPNNYDQLILKNENILVCLTDGLGSFLGYFDVIPVTQTFAQSFIAGLVTEDQLTHEHVLSPTEASHCKYVFIAGLCAKDPHTHVGRRSACVLVWGLLKYLEAKYARQKPLTFAVAAKDAGYDLLKRFEREPARKAQERKDGYDLFSATISSDEIARRLAYVRDWSGLCTLLWERSPPRAPARRRSAAPREPSMARKRRPRIDKKSPRSRP